MKDFPKKYDATLESKLYEHWSSTGVFEPDTVLAYRKKHQLPLVDKQFTIPLPPPNVTGKLHIGHAMMAAVEDILVRRHRMSWYRTLWIPGTDHAALSTNAVVEKKLRKEWKNRHDMWRDAYLTEVRKWVTEHRWHITGQMKALGSSMDRGREQYTMSESLSRSVRQAFKFLYDKKKIYQDYYVINRSPGAQSVVSDIEVEHKEEISKLYYIRYFVDTKKHVLTVATTRPETMFADVAVAVHPDDRRYKKFIGKRVIIPLINRTIPIIGDESVDMTFGTWVLKITPGHSQADFEIAKRHNLPLNVFAFDKDEVFTKEAGELFEWKKINEFMENVIQYISDIGNLDRVEDHTHSVPYCERTGCLIQPMASKQRFMSSETAADKIIHHLDEWDVQVHPERFGKTFHDWLEKLRPWCISRQIWWGHRIPVRYDENWEHFVFTEDTILYDASWTARKESGNIVFAMMLFNLIADGRLPAEFSVDALMDVLMEDSLTPQHGSVLDSYMRVYRQKLLETTEASFKKWMKWLEALLVLRDESGKEMEFAEKIVDMTSDCFLVESYKQHYRFNPNVLVDGDKELRQETDTLDTRFSSALRPFSILWWPEKTEDLWLYYPNSVLETGYDIILFRVIKMMIMWVEVMGSMPFDHVYLHGLVRDSKWVKMSKSIGNVINPLEMIEKYGSDALRLWLVSNSKPGNDVNFSEDKTKYYRRFLNKLWNASRFVMMNVWDDLPRDLAKLEKTIVTWMDELHDFDIRLLHILKDLIYDTDKAFDRFNLWEASHHICQSVRQYYCDWYIEISKVHSSDLTHTVLLYTLARLLQLLHPFAPYVTASLWTNIGFDTELAMRDIPRLGFEPPTKNYRHNLMMDVVTQLRNLKNQVTDKGHHEVDAFVQWASDITSYLQEHEWLIKSLVGIKEITYLREWQEVPDGYQTGLVINVTLGVKWVQVVEKGQVLKDLQKQLSDEQTFLQNLRNTLMKPWFKDNAPAAVVEAKEKKMDEVKQKIEWLEHEIKRLKAGL